MSLFLSVTMLCNAFSPSHYTWCYLRTIFGIWLLSHVHMTIFHPSYRWNSITIIIYITHSLCNSQILLWRSIPASTSYRVICECSTKILKKEKNNLKNNMKSCKSVSVGFVNNCNTIAPWFEEKKWAERIIKQTVYA